MIDKPMPKSDVEFHVRFNHGEEDNDLWRRTWEDFKTECISAALLRTYGNKAKAARLLGMRRTTLMEMMRTLGIYWANGDIGIVPPSGDKRLPPGYQEGQDG